MIRGMLASLSKRQSNRICSLTIGLWNVSAFLTFQPVHRKPPLQRATKMKHNTAIVLLLLSLGLFYTFTNSQYREVKELSALANEYQSVLKNISQIVELRDSLLATYATIPVVEIDRMNKVLPDNIDTVRLALDLD